MRKLPSEPPGPNSISHFSWSKQQCHPCFILLKFCLFQHSLPLRWYRPSGIWAKDKLHACGKCLCGCSSQCISNSWTHVTTCWTHWTLLALKQCCSEPWGVLAGLAETWSETVDAGGEENRWMNVDWKMGWGKLLWWGSTAIGYEHSACLLWP